MALPKLDGETVISAATVLGTFAGFAVSLDAGRYYWASTGPSGAASLLAHLKTKLDAATGRTWTLTLDDDTDTATGKLTLACSGAATTATWTSTALRDWLGFTGNLGSGTSWQSQNQVRALYLPTCARSEPLGPDVSNGVAVSDYSIAVAPSGHTYAVGYSTRYADELKFGHLIGSKVWKALEVTVNESLERFWEDVIRYGFSFAYHSDRAVDATRRQWVAENGGEFIPRARDPRWTESAKSLWAIAYRVLKFEA